MAEGGVSGAQIAGLSLEEQLSKFPAQLLDHPCVDTHRVQLTECFSEWQLANFPLVWSYLQWRLEILRAIDLEMLPDNDWRCLGEEKRTCHSQVCLIN